MNQFKPSQVIMLPASSGENFPILKNVNRRGKQLYLPTKNYHYTKSYLEVEEFEAYHLYITTDDEIEEGDWVYYKNGDLEGIHQVVSGQRPKAMILKKIIATTDSSLMIYKDYTRKQRGKINLPQPSQQFIEQYIESYNKGEVITNVLVEYEWYHNKQSCFKTMCYKQDMEGRDSCVGMCEAQRIKVNPKDNTINIKPFKDSWSREEVKEIVRKSIADTNKSNQRNISMDYKNWIKENL